MDSDLLKSATEVADGKKNQEQKAGEEKKVPGILTRLPCGHQIGPRLEGASPFEMCWWSLVWKLSAGYM